MRKFDPFVSAGAIAIGLVIFWYSRSLSTISPEGIPGEAFWPRMMASLLILLGVLQVGKRVAFPKMDADKVVTLFSPANRRAYVVAVVAFGFAALMSQVGFIIATLVFMPVVVALLGERRPLVVAIATLGMVAVIWFFFVKIFNITLPGAPFLD